MCCLVSAAQCPPGWLAHGSSCYTLRRAGQTWSDAQRRCTDVAAGSHLADLKTPDDLLFISSHLLKHNSLLLLWTGLNDQQVASLLGCTVHTIETNTLGVLQFFLEVKETTS